MLHAHPDYCRWYSILTPTARDMIAKAAKAAVDEGWSLSQAIALLDFCYIAEADAVATPAHDLPDIPADRPLTS